MRLRAGLTALTAVVCFEAAWAQTPQGAPPVGFPPDPLGAAAAPAPPPPPDPETWWSTPDVRNELIDPLGGRRPAKNAAAIPAPVDASVYRLWGLMPLQTQVLRRDETVFEIWVRPVDANRQAVVRATLRTDGRVFLQARAGRGCCGPGVGRRVDIDKELDRNAAQAFRALRSDPLWTQPRHVLVQEEGAVSALCVDGTSYDITRAELRRSMHVRRSCDPAEVGSAAMVLRTVLGAAMGQDPRFDAAIKGGAGFEREAREYAALQARGGRLAPKQDRSDSGRASEPAPAPADEPAEDDPRAEVLAADRAFAARAQVVGAAQAFREFADPDEGKMWPTGGEPVVGDEAIYAFMGGDAPAQGALLWEPAEAVVSESGEFAATWGRSRSVPNDREQPVSVGRYITVWRKDEDGRWRFLWDLGNSRRLQPGEAPAGGTPPAAPPGSAAALTQP
jgi:ketosteroid isomerase-like protein